MAKNLRSCVTTCLQHKRMKVLPTSLQQPFRNKAVEFYKRNGIFCIFGKFSNHQHSFKRFTLYFTKYKTDLTTSNIFLMFLCCHIFWRIFGKIWNSCKIETTKHLTGFLPHMGNFCQKVNCQMLDGNTKFLHPLSEQNF
jgi:hypothetical protein